ncbi:cytochrome P460 family protein, partial [bacterium]|nr:cytochrome P460 family protein [bacterium]
PAYLSRLCVAPDPEPTKEEKKDYGPHARTYLRVYANPIAVKSLTSDGSFPEGSILLKEKMFVNSEEPEAYGVLIKHGKGYNPSTADWEFAFYPSAKGSSFNNCAACHKTASHDYVFTPYISDK